MAWIQSPGYEENSTYNGETQRTNENQYQILGSRDTV